MHIPDGYLSPETCVVLGRGDGAGVWVGAGRRVRRVVKTRHVPWLAMGAAYCFLVMMFNVPIPDGTTAHAVGAVLVAVLLGPEAAIVAVSVASPSRRSSSVMAACSPIPPMPSTWPS